MELRLQGEHCLSECSSSALQVNTFVLLRVVTVTVASARRRSKMLTPNSSLENQIGTHIW